MIRKIILSAISIAALLIAILSSFGEESSSALVGIWLTFSLFAFAISFPEAIKSISFLGGKIEPRLEEKINELKTLAEINAKLFLDLMQGRSRLGPSSEKYMDEVYHDIEKVLRTCGSSSEEIRKIQSNWHRWVEFDYIHGILSPRSQIHHPLVKEQKDEWVKKRKQIYDSTENAQNVDAVSPDQLRELFRKFDSYDDKIKELIDDFEYYRKNKKHRDTERWKKRHNWF